MRKYLNFIFQPLITRDFLNKLVDNFHTLTPFEMFIYLIFIRPFWSKDRRFFFEGSLRLYGQMFTSERKALFDTIVKSKPRQCFEVGTFTGGGSTFFLSSAFAKLGSGKLITMESTDHYFNKAKNYYATSLPELNTHITFVHGSTPDKFDAYIPDNKKVDCVLFDGSDTGQETVDQYHYFLPYFKTGSIIMFHDWDTVKTKMIMPTILNDPRWEKILELTPPTSVGMAIFKHL